LTASSAVDENRGMSERRISSFREFWPFYVGEHRTSGCRWLHFFGTSCTLASFAAFLITMRWEFLPLAVVSGYAPSWIGHFFIEGNRPATWRYPLWSLIADFRMYGKMWLGRMDEELARLTAR
jgi:hypothetical protein